VTSTKAPPCGTYLGYLAISPYSRRKNRRPSLTFREIRRIYANLRKVPVEGATYFVEVWKVPPTFLDRRAFHGSASHSRVDASRRRFSPALGDSRSGAHILGGERQRRGRKLAAEPAPPGRPYVMSAVRPGTGRDATKPPAPQGLAPGEHPRLSARSGPSPRRSIPLARLLLCLSVERTNPQSLSTESATARRQAP